MTVRLNHTIVAARDKETAAMFLTEILGLPAPSLFGPFAVVRVGDDTSLDYIDTDDEITSQHYAFLVSEIEFDEIFEPDFDSCYGHDCYLVGQINALEVLAKTPLYAEG